MTIKSLPSIYPGKSLIQTGNLSFFLPLLLLAACTGAPKDDGRSVPPPLYQPPRSFPANPKGGYAVNPVTGDSIQPIINRSGDTLITGEPIPTEGKRIHSSSVAKPQVVKVPAVGSLKRYNAQSNNYKVPEKLPTFPVDESKLTKKSVIQVAKGDTTHYIINSIGQKVPTGVPIPAKGKKVPSKYPQPTQALPPAKKDAAIANIQYMDVRHGMASYAVWSIIEDRNGNLWFGTDASGVSKYDGQSFTHFTEKEGLSNNRVISILEDKSGNLWFGTVGGGVNKYDGNSFTHFTEKEGLSNNSVRSIVEDKNGNLWFGTAGGVSKYDGQSFTHFTEREGLSNNSVRSIVEDKNGNLWFGTDRGVNKYDGNSFTHFTEKEGLSNNSVRSIVEDKNGNLWFGTDRGGVNKYNGQSFTHFTEKEGLSNNRVISILEDKSGNLWFGTDGGVCKYDGRFFTHFTEKEGLSNNSVFTMAEDKNGNLWIGTQGGVNKYDWKSFTHFTEREGLSDNIVRSIVEDKNGSLWFGTRGGVNKYDGNSFFHFTEKEGLSYNIVSSILEDKNGNLWFGTTGGGVSKYDGKSFTHFTENEGLSDNNIWSIAEDKNGNLWFGTARGGVNKYDGKSFTHFTEREGLSDNIVRSIVEDKNGNLWFGTDGGGVNKYDGKSFTHFTEKEGLSNNRVRSIAEDKNGNLWFGTDGGGVNKYDGKSFTYFTEKEGLNNNSVRSIAEDKNGNLWFGTFDGGVSKYDGKSFIYFTEKEGLSHNSVRSIVEDKEGNLWFGTWGGGVNKMGKDAYQASPQPLVVHLRHLYVNDALPNYRNPSDSSIQDIKFDSVQAFENYPIHPRIPFDQNHLSFQFSAIDWSAPTKIKYSFRLLGLDNNWSNPSEKTLADYRNLPHGKFTFQVRAIGDSGVWSNSFDYSFTILPPWWKTWWAYTIYALLFLGALKMFSLWRERKLREEKEQLKQKVEERTVELKQKSEQLEHSLTDLKSTQAQLIQSEKLASLGELTAGIAHEIQNPLNFVNNFSELSVELIEELGPPAPNGGAPDTPFGGWGAFLGDLKQNLEKINHHGKRASSIVKGMLEHSRASTGVKELTDINALADEYLRLAYHGLRAKDSTFNSDFKTDFDENLPKIEVIPQDIGRVLLNLINNAFWAVKSPQPAAADRPNGGTKKTPLVTVSTKYLAPLSGAGDGTPRGAIIIQVKDNGKGIPQKILDKIFQPFFTTKPTGQGTGLGLSLSYDIIKAHGGEIKIQTIENEGTEFTIQLPI